MANKILFIDTETGGITENSALIQLSGIIQIDGKVKEEFNFLMKPYDGSEVTNKALEIQGRTREEVYAYSNEKDAYKEVRRILDEYVDKFDKSDKFIIAGYNVRFDIEVMNRFFKRNGDNFLFSYIDSCTLDPLNLVAILQLCGILPKLENNKLETWCNYFGIELKAHDALEDIKATRELLREFTKLFYIKEQING